MGQQEVYDFLKRNKSRWFTSKEIKQKLNVSLGSVTNNLAKLRRRKEVFAKPSGNRNEYKYKFKK